MSLECLACALPDPLHTRGPGQAGTYTRATGARATTASGQTQAAKQLSGAPPRQSGHRRRAPEAPAASSLGSRGVAPAPRLRRVPSISVEHRRNCDSAENSPLCGTARLRFNFGMRSVLGKLASVLALAIAAVAWCSPDAGAHGVRTHDVQVATLARGDAAPLDAPFSSGPLSSGSSEATTDPAADPDGDSLGSEREAPEALPVFAGNGLEAPRPSWFDHHSSASDDTMDRAIVPVVQPPRG